MKYLKQFLFFVFLLVLGVSCADDPDPDFDIVPVDRTVLIYMAGNNNLSSYMSDNLDAMCQGMKGVGGTLVVYFASTSSESQLYRIGSDGTKTLLNAYEEQDSADPETLRSVVNDVFERYPAASYGLVLSSHADGWFPASSYLNARMMREDPNPHAMLTKWFGQDVSFASYMNIPDMAAALPVGRQLDFLLFDACFMASVEALYDLRDNARYIIASPTEVMANGFPYAQIVPMMFQENLDLKPICQSYVDFYRGTQYPSASVALINTAELEPLAETVREVMAHHSNSSLDLNSIQYLEGKTTHTYYDLADYLSKLSGGDLYYQAVVAQLGKTVEYVEYTPEIYSSYGAGGFFSLNTCCGLSSFIPQSMPAYLNAYRETSWAKAIAY